ncbi:MAG: hypothetical protein ABIC95_07320 [archaeon]
MADGDLEQMISDEPSKKKAPFWDYLVSAYSSGSGLQAALTASAAGYTLLAVLGAAGITYGVVKTVGIGAKMTARFIRHPGNYLEHFWGNCKEAITDYWPFGKYKLPSGLGSTITALKAVGL